MASDFLHWYDYDYENGLDTGIRLTSKLIERTTRDYFCEDFTTLPRKWEERASLAIIELARVQLLKWQAEMHRNNDRE